ncbi:MAG: cytochrome o ubiquinol oxidase subunit IV [Pseudomonadota bacterium]
MSDHNHDDTNSGVEMHATFRGYMTGFWLSVVLTVIPFWLVMGDVMTNPHLAAFVVIGLGGLQMIVHMIYFLHMNTRAEAGWLAMSMVFTILLLIIAVVGSLWIMYHLDTNMMPGMAAQMQNPTMSLT